MLLIIFLLINSELNLLDIPITSNVAFAILVFSLSIYSFVRKQFIMACLLLAWSYRLISLAYPIPRLSFWVAYLSAFILGIVLGNIFKTYSFNFVYVGKSKYDFKKHKHSNVENFSDENILNIKTLFSDKVKYVKNNSIKKVNVKGIFHDTSIHFEDVYSSGSIIDIDINSIFGELNIYFPRSWNIINKVDNCFASVSEILTNGDVSKPQDDPVTVYINGNILFSGAKFIKF